MDAAPTHLRRALRVRYDSLEFAPGGFRDFAPGTLQQNGISQLEPSGNFGKGCAIPLFSPFWLWFWH
jgi:hypothetical protein